MHSMNRIIELLVAVDLADLVDGELAVLVHLDKLWNVFGWVAVALA